jgi:cytochrome c oxidase assembly protein subunit 11
MTGSTRNADRAGSGSGTAPDPRRDPARMKRRNGVVLASAFGIVFGMVGLSFAAVPLYDLFCRVTGFGGTTQTAVGTTGEVLDRTVQVRFTADTDAALPWRFEAEQRSVEVRIGEPALVYYTATNESDAPVAGQAVYNVSPAKSGIYFYKVQCFCFQEQVLMPGESVEFPVYFYVDPSMDGDRALDDVQTLTLSYRFYPTESKQLDDAIEDYYRSIEGIEAETAMVAE